MNHERAFDHDCFVLKFSQHEYKMSKKTYTRFA